MKQSPIRNQSPNREAISTSKSTAPPLGGWNTRDPEANMDSKYALTLDNWFPDTGSIGLRPGATNFVTSIGGNLQAKTLGAWKGTSAQKLFAFTDNGVYDVSTINAAGTLVHPYTSGYACNINFVTTGGSFLVTVNGVDDLAYTNGTTWNTVASFTISAGGTLITNQIDNISSFKRSIFFVKKNSMSFFFLPIDSITGVVSEFPVGGLFNKGGKLVACGTWTIDGGQGMDDYSVFITDQGQAAIYQGTDPSSASTWLLKGIYDLAPPIGKKCFCRFGGDLLVLTRRGLFSMTRTLRDKMMIQSAALSDAVGEAFTRSAAITGDLEGWEVIEFPTYNAIVCNVPQGQYTTSHQYVMNTKTGAWCRFKGWDAFSFAFFNNKLYMGMAGKIGQAFVPGNDFNASITAEARTAFNYYSPRSRLKSWKLLRPNLLIGGSCAVNIALDTDFSAGTDYGAAVFNSTTEARWDAANWGSSAWSSEPSSRSEWITAAAADSYCAAIRLRVIARSSTIRWSATDVVYAVGGMVG